jgi:hypothetical protein
LRSGVKKSSARANWASGLVTTNLRTDRRPSFQRGHRGDRKRT